MQHLSHDEYDSDSSEFSDDISETHLDNSNLTLQSLDDIERVSKQPSIGKQPRVTGKQPRVTVNTGKQPREQPQVSEKQRKPRKQAHPQKRPRQDLNTDDGSKRKKGKNGYTMYMRKRSKILFNELGSMNEAMKQVGREWKSLSEEEKKVYKEEAKTAVDIPKRRKPSKGNVKTKLGNISELDSDEYAGITREKRTSQLDNIKSVELAMQSFSESVRKLTYKPESCKTQTLNVQTVMEKMFSGRLKMDFRNRHSQRDITSQYVQAYMTSLLLIPQGNASREVAIRDHILATQEPITFKDATLEQGVQLISNGGHRIMSFMSILFGLVPMPVSIGSKQSFFLVPSDDVTASSHPHFKFKEGIQHFYEAVGDKEDSLLAELKQIIRVHDTEIVDPNFTNKKINKRRQKLISTILQLSLKIETYSIENTIVSQLKRLHRIASTPETIINFLVDSPNVPDDLSRLLNDEIDQRITLSENHLFKKVLGRSASSYQLPKLCDTKSMMWACLLTLCGFHDTGNTVITQNLKVPTGFASDNINMAHLNVLCDTLTRIQNEKLTSKMLDQEHDDTGAYLLNVFKCLYERLTAEISRLDQEAVESIIRNKKVAGYSLHACARDVQGNTQKMIVFHMYLLVNSFFGKPLGKEMHASYDTGASVAMSKLANGTFKFKKAKLYPVFKMFSRDLLMHGKPLAEAIENVRKTYTMNHRLI